MVTPRFVKPMPMAALAGLSTPRLLAYRARMLRLEDTIAASDWSAAEVAALDPDRFYFKEDPRWQALYAGLLRLLAEREHVP